MFVYIEHIQRDLKLTIVELNHDYPQQQSVRYPIEATA